MVEKTPFSKLDHVGIIVRDMEKAMAHYNSFGIGPFREGSMEGIIEKTMNGKPVDFKVRTAKADLGGTTLELIQPVKDALLMEDFLKRRGEGVHHLAFQVDDLDKEVDRLARKGYEVVLTARFPGGRGGVYLDVGKVGGMLIEFVKR